MRNITPVVKNFIILNALMLLATFVIKSRFGIDLNERLGLYYIESPLFKPFQFVTYMFLHGDLFHLFFNMFALYMFGTALESYWGSQRFFVFYIITVLILHH